MTYIGKLAEVEGADPTEGTAAWKYVNGDVINSIDGNGAFAIPVMHAGAAGGCLYNIFLEKAGHDPDSPKSGSYGCACLGGLIAGLGSGFSGGVIMTGLGAYTQCVCKTKNPNCGLASAAGAAVLGCIAGWLFRNLAASENPQELAQGVADAMGLSALGSLGGAAAETCCRGSL